MPVRAASLLSAPTLDRLAGSVHGAATSEPVFGLTFDDGPDLANTPEVLEALAERSARATFFVLLRSARQHRSLISDVLSAGHEVGLHGDEHLDLSRCSPVTVVAQIHRARARLEQLIAREVRYFRPPYGTQNIRSYLISRAAGLEVVAWTASPRDFLALDLDQQVGLAVDELRPGGILLLHDGPPAAPLRRRRVVELLLDRAAESGLRPVTVGELLARGEPIRRTWFRGRAESLIEEMSPFLLGNGRTELR